MDLKECLELLGLQNATSPKQVETAYRNMVHTWNPERFPFDAELRKHAEEKLRDIELAYKRVLAHLSSEPERDKRSWLDRKPDTSINPAERPETAGHYAKSPYVQPAAGRSSGTPRQRPPMRPSSPGAAQTSSAGKYMVIGLLLLLAGFTVFIVKYLLALDQTRIGNRAPTTSIMKKLTDDPQSSKPVKKPSSRKPKLIETGSSRKAKPASGLSNRQGNYYEIYLKEGSVIIAERWWEQGDMIMYKTRLGTMGVEKNMVANIVSK